MSTIYDVARRAGVSPKTVSRVLNGDGPVGEQTRQHVEEAMRALGYVRSNAARMMRAQKSGIVGLITCLGVAHREASGRMVRVRSGRPVPVPGLRPAGSKPRLRMRKASCPSRSRKLLSLPRMHASRRWRHSCSRTSTHLRYSRVNFQRRSIFLTEASQISLLRRSPLESRQSCYRGVLM